MSDAPNFTKPLKWMFDQVLVNGHQPSHTPVTTWPDINFHFVFCVLPGEYLKMLELPAIFLAYYIQRVFDYIISSYLDRKREQSFWPVYVSKKTKSAKLNKS